MQKVYLLLRNNKQQGPYSLEELLEQNLKNFDLVWVEGKSAGWRYPSEIDQLKTFMAPEEPVLPREVITEVISQQPAAVYETTIKKPVKVYVSLPVNPASSLITQEEISPADKLALKAEALYKRAQAFTASKATGSEPEMDIKFERSLDDIKQEYSSWLHEQKSGRKKGKKLSVSYLSVSFAFILMAGLVAAYFFYPFNNSGQKNISETDAHDNIAASSKNIIPVRNTTNSISSGSISKKKTGNSKRKNIPVYKQGAGRSNNSNLPVKKPILKNTVPLPQLVKLRGQHPANTGNGVPDFKLILQNNSSSNIELATAEVLYYSTSGKLLSRKTVYFSNIAPGASVIRYVTGNNRAGEVHYQLGKISKARPANFYAAK